MFAKTILSISNKSFRKIALWRLLSSSKVLFFLHFTNKTDFNLEGFIRSLRSFNLSVSSVPSISYLKDKNLPNFIGSSSWVISSLDIDSFFRFWYSSSFIYDGSLTFSGIIFQNRCLQLNDTTTKNLKIVFFKPIVRLTSLMFMVFECIFRVLKCLKSLFFKFNVLFNYLQNYDN